MKHVKKLFAFALTLVMAFAIALPAFAEGDDAPVAPPTAGSITVNPNNKGQTYTLYKLFDAHITFKNDGTAAAITYTLPTGKTLGTTGEQWFTINSNGFVEEKDALTDDVMKSTEFITWAKSIGTQQGDAITAASDNDTNVKWENIPFGYYFVDSTLGAFIAVDSDNPSATVQDKNNPPKLDKKIKSVKDADGNDDGSIFKATDAAEIQFEGDGSNEHAIAQIGDTITYTIDVTAQPGAENYIVTDTLDAGLTAPEAKDVSVKVGNTALTADQVTVAVDGQVITVTFDNGYLNSIKQATVITIEYTAKLNDKAVVATNSNDNTAKLEWGHKPTKDHTEDESKVWTAEVQVEKRIDNESGEFLAGAGFKLKKGDKFYNIDNDGNVVWDTTGKEIFTGEDGKLAQSFKGLANGSYTLVETTVPDGYNKLADTDVTIAGSDVTVGNLSQTKKVVNNTGTELPSTGGIGTTIFYIVGGAMVVGGGVFLLTKRRMSAE